MLNNIIKKTKAVKSRFLSGKKSKLFIVVLILNSTFLIHNCFAQNIGISSTGATPDNSAMLDVVSTTKGMLIPRMTGTEKYAVPSPATGLLIFQTDTVGFWYYNGTKWLPLLSSTSSTTGSTGGWGLSGNGSTTASNFLGTTDNVSLRLKANDTTRVIVDSLGRVGVGTTAPAGKFHVNNDVSGSDSSFVVTSGGNVGIGTTSPTAKIGIKGNQAETSSTFEPFLRFDVVGGLVSQIYRDYNGTNNYIGWESFNVGNTVKTPIVLQEYGGNVGIGTTSPGQKLSVAGTVESTSGGFKFPDGTVQTTAIPGAWTAFTPTLTAGSGSLTTASATGRYVQIGKTVSFTMTITITTNGTAGIWIGATLPVASNSEAIVSGRDDTIGTMLQGHISPGGTQVAILTYSNGYPGANGRVLLVSGTYESQ